MHRDFHRLDTPNGFTRASSNGGLLSVACVALLCHATLLLLSGCAPRGVGITVGRSLADGATGYLQSARGRAAIRSFVDSSMTSVTASFEDRLMPRVDAAVDAVLADARGAVGKIESDVAASLDGRLAEASERYLTRSIRAAGLETRLQLAAALREAGEHTRADLTPALTAGIRDATRELVREFSHGVRTDLRVAAESALAGVVRTGVREGRSEVKRSPIPWVVGGGAGALILASMIWVIRDRRRGLAALEVIAEQLNLHGDAALKAEIRARGVERGTEGWLHSFLSRRKRLS